VLIDLNGYKPENRAKILAYRPAPIQVNFLGYPGTTGADFVDYIIVDRFVVPADQRRFFSERLVHLPHSYQCNDDKREIAAATPSRIDCALPETGFVFCCFNDNYKITPDFFDIWMRLLHAVPGSVLWLTRARCCRQGQSRARSDGARHRSRALGFCPAPTAIRAPRPPSRRRPLSRYVAFQCAYDGE
jgi:predicted O-linked N-acetylglucosamine transferase (SPINDLY family)